MVSQTPDGARLTGEQDADQASWHALHPPCSKATLEMRWWKNARLRQAYGQPAPKLFVTLAPALLEAGPSERKQASTCAQEQALCGGKPGGVQGRGSAPAHQSKVEVHGGRRQLLGIHALAEVHLTVPRLVAAIQLPPKGGRSFGLAPACRRHTRSQCSTLRSSVPFSTQRH